MRKINFVNLASFEKRLIDKGWTITGYITTKDELAVCAERRLDGITIKREFKNFNMSKNKLDDDVLRIEENRFAKKNQLNK